MAKAALLRTPSRGRERGQALFVIAASAVVLVTMLGLVVDGAMVNLQKRREQNAADAASWAATEYLRKTATPNDGTLNSVVQWYVNQNIALSQCVNGSGSNDYSASYIDSGNNNVGQVGSYGNSPIPSAASGIAVQVHCTYQTSFLAVININTFTPNTRAAARFGYVNSVSTSTPPVGAPYTAPLALDWNTYQSLLGNGYGVDVSFTQAKNNGNGCYFSGSACFYWNQLNDNSGNNSDNITAGLITDPAQYNLPPVSIGDMIHTTPGNRANLYDLFNQQYAGTTIVIPIIETGATKSDIPVDGFAYLHIEASSSGHAVTAYLVNPDSAGTPVYPGPVTSTPPPHNITTLTGVSFVQ